MQCLIFDSGRIDRLAGLRLRACNPGLPILAVQFFKQTQASLRVAARGGGKKRRLDIALGNHHVRPGIDHLIDALAAAAGNLPDVLQLVVAAPANQ